LFIVEYYGIILIVEYCDIFLLKANQKNMGIEQKNNTDEKKFVLTFSNAAYKQLEELQKSYKLKDMYSIVELGINILELAQKKKILLEDEKGELNRVKVNEE